jgi:hypothetical protein
LNMLIMWSQKRAATAKWSAPQRTTPVFSKPQVWGSGSWIRRSEGFLGCAL